jgi:hypothetical protein
MPPVKLTHDHLSAISGITLDGRLFMQVREDTYDAEGSTASCGCCCARSAARWS